MAIEWCREHTMTLPPSETLCMCAKGTSMWGYVHMEARVMDGVFLNCFSTLCF